MELNQITTIRDHQRRVAAIYGAKNASQDWPYLAAYLGRSVGYQWKAVVSKGVRPTHFIRPLSWLLAMAGRLNVDLQTAFFRRFPGKCPYCLGAPCICLRTGKRPNPPKGAYKIREDLDYAANDLMALSTFHPTLRSASDMLERIYPNNRVVWHCAGPSFHFAKLNEEVAEVHEAWSKFEIHERREDAVAAELADVFAWLVAAWPLVLPDQDFDDEFVSAYFDGCPVCMKPACECGRFGSRPTGLVDMKVVQQLRDQVSRVRSLLPGEARADFEELLLSLDTLLRTKDEPLARHSIAEAREAIQRWRQPDRAQQINAQALAAMELIAQTASRLGSP